MKTACKPKQPAFQPRGRRQVTGRSDGGRITSDGGGLRRCEVDQRIGLLDRPAGCFTERPSMGAGTAVDDTRRRQYLVMGRGLSVSHSMIVNGKVTPWQLILGLGRGICVRSAMVRRKITIVNKLGLHARAAAKLVTMAGLFKSSVQLAKGDRVVNAKSIMAVMMLAAAKGHELELIVDGPDEEQAAMMIEELIKKRFGEEE